MKVYLTIIISLLVIFSCGPTKQNSVQVPESEKQVVTVADPTVYAQTITAGELKEMLYTYASDEFEGRETGKPGQKKAVDYLRKHYIDMGIVSPFSSGDYFQKVPFEEQKSPEVSVEVDGQTYENFKDFISVGSAVTTHISVDEIIYAGYGIEDENYSDYEGLDVTGRVVFIKAGEPKNADGTYVTSGGAEPTKWVNGRQARNSKKDVAEKKGAKALIMMDDTTFERTASFYSRFANSGGAGRVSLKSNVQGMVELIVNKGFGKAIFDKVDTEDGSMTLHKNLTIDVKGNTEDLYSENVAAFIKGSEKPDEIIIISAHLDHIGIGRDGQINNGADDDGSGTIAILEIAEAFEKAVKDGHRPKRSILFLHVTGEEKGLLGSKYYTDFSPIFPLENTVVDLNMDMIGRVDPEHKNNKNYVYLIGSDKLSSELHDISENTNGKYTNLNLDYKYNDENDPNRFYYRSDHYNFAKNNIPVIFYFNGTHADYHRPGDTPDKIEYDIYETRARLVFHTAWELANRDQRIVVDKASTE